MFFGYGRKLKKELTQSLETEKPDVWSYIAEHAKDSMEKDKKECIEGYCIEGCDIEKDGIEGDKPQINSIEVNNGVEKPVKTFRRALKPVFAFAIVLTVLLSSFSVLAIVNEDVRSYLFAAFGDKTANIDGEFVGASVESDGYRLTVNAIIPQADSFYLFFTLTDTLNRLVKEEVKLKDWSFKVDDSTGWSAYHVREIKNGEPTYIIFSLGNADKLSGKKKVEFGINSVTAITPKSVSIEIPLDKKDYSPVEGFEIKKITVQDGYISLYMDTDTSKKAYVLESVKIVNKKTGTEYNFREEHATQENDSSINKARKISEKIDGQINPEDYTIKMLFLENLQIVPGLKAEFTVDFSKKPLAVIKPKDVFVRESYGGQEIKSKLVKVTVNQLNINMEFEKVKEVPLDQMQAEAIKEVPVEGAAVEDIPQREQVDGNEGVKLPGTADVKPQIFCSVIDPPEIHNIFIVYEDGSKVTSSFIQTEIKYSQFARRTIMLKEPVDLTRKPVLHIGDVEIALYK